MTTFIDGFEEFYGSTTPAVLLQRAEWIPQGSWGIVQGRSSQPGSTAMSGARTALKRLVPWVGNAFSAGVACIFAGRGALIQLDMDGVKSTLWCNPTSGLPMLNEQPGGALPTTNRWYYYELVVDRAAGTVALWINNKLDSTFTLPAGAAAADEVMVTIGWVNEDDYWPGPDAPPPDNSVKTFDDFYVRDAGRLGPIIITTRFPDIDENVEWFKASTSLTHAESLSQHPPDPLDSYVASDTIGEEDRFTSNDVLVNTNDVLVTGIVVMARKAPSLNAKLGVFMGGNAGAAARSATRSVDSDWRTQYITFEATAGDTPAGIEASEFGINVAAP